ncbi:NIF family HAD-type phosphatase [Stenotrophomonas maltophilia]|uniref:NIF family HAD-type phosphatase n=1 Tax=Stenotrophomonas maltophilia TaxID=40324 RepID=UPI001110EB77|nr:NIF family HAD-type phosphatase [Stenotrophomonas maltophilia]MCU1206317.1 hypothetical protein [Stenotrophomonas maltophilia]TIL14092.1 hypothetical protein E4419_13045 [Stenotrophomonas maltophilia]
MKPTILALDLEGTLISNAISQIPRPGLYRFLVGMRSKFDQLVIFTTVPEERVHQIAELLVAEGSAPDWFAQLRYVRWSGETKDLSYVSSCVGDALLLDDYASYVHPGQEHLWVEVPLFGSPYLPNDGGLEIASQRVVMRISQLESR